jgi:hypothetical protein
MKINKKKKKKKKINKDERVGVVAPSSTLVPRGGLQYPCRVDGA